MEEVDIAWTVAFVLAFLLGWLHSRCMAVGAKVDFLIRTLVHVSITDNPAGPSGTEEIMPDRACPFPQCGKPIDPTMFCCRRHWGDMTEDDRKEVWRQWDQYKSRKITIKKLREFHAEIVAKYPDPSGRSATSGSDLKRLEAFAMLTEVFLKKDAEYRKCPEQLMDQKKKLGREHQRLLIQLKAAIHDILHPNQVQPGLFDNTPPEKGPTNMPD